MRYREIKVNQSEADAIDRAITILDSAMLMGGKDPGTMQAVGHLRMLAAKYRWAGTPLRRAPRPLTDEEVEEGMADVARYNQWEDATFGTAEDNYDGSP